MNERVWLLNLRTKKGLTQQQVADIVQTTQQHYSAIEKGDRRPSPRLAKRIGSLLGFDWTVFFDEDSATKETA